MKRFMGCLMIAACLLFAAGIACAVEDGLGTNYVGVLQAGGISLGGELRTSWPEDFGSVGGGPADFRAHSNEVFWSPVFRFTGTLAKVQLQTDQGTADGNVVRSKWNDPWGSYTNVNNFHADASGAEDSSWSSAWVSNDYRIGIVVTNFTTGTNLWWSVQYER